MFLTIGTEKVFSSKNSLFSKKLLLQSHTDASFANKRSNFKKIFVLHTMIFKIKRKACKCREKERIFVEKREQHTENKQAFHDGTHMSQLLIIEQESFAEPVRKYRCLYLKNLVQATKTKPLLKMLGPRSIKKWALKRVRSFLFSYVA